MRKNILGVVGCLLFVGCSVNPYEKGADLASGYDACVSSYIAAAEQIGDDFAGQIPGNYQSRAKAVEDYLSLVDECYMDYLRKWQKIEAKERTVRKSLKSASELADFESGLASNRVNHSFVVEPDANNIEIPAPVIKQLRTIFPPKPGDNQIIVDLVGHSLSEGKSNGYYPQSWRWIIEENSISDFKIISTEEDSKNRYTILTTMRLCSDTRAYDTKAQISYILDDLHDWTIEFVQSKGMDIVKTHRYDDCVKCYISRGGLIGNLLAENNCEIALEVAGRELNHSGEWVTFCCIVPPHQQKVISNNDTDFRIDYIERP